MKAKIRGSTAAKGAADPVDPGPKGSVDLVRMGLVDLAGMTAARAASAVVRAPRAGDREIFAVRGGVVRHRNGGNRCHCRKLRLHFCLTTKWWNRSPGRFG